MDKIIRKAQDSVLKVFAEKARNFALAGGTALELYYLHHRFSVDLDFFSTKYSISEINNLVRAFEKSIKHKIKLETEFTSNNKARVRFYAVPVKRSERFLKIDFVEDVLFENPSIRTIKGVRVYSAENLYFQKIVAISGIRFEIDSVGREIAGGRKEARDVFDIYMLSRKIKPLHVFMKTIPAELQRGMIHWYRTFSRQGLKLALLELDIYDKSFNSKEMIIYLENEIKLFMREVIKE